MSCVGPSGPTLTGGFERAQLPDVGDEAATGSARNSRTIGQPSCPGWEVDELFDAWGRAWWGRAPRAFESVCAPDVHYEDPLTAAPLIGVRALKRHAKQLWAAMPD